MKKLLLYSVIVTFLGVFSESCTLVIDPVNPPVESLDSLKPSAARLDGGCDFFMSSGGRFQMDIWHDSSSVLIDTLEPTDHKISGKIILRQNQFFGSNDPFIRRIELRFRKVGISNAPVRMTSSNCIILVARDGVTNPIDFGQYYNSVTYDLRKTPGKKEFYLSLDIKVYKDSKNYGWCPPENNKIIIRY